MWLFHLTRWIFKIFFSICQKQKTSPCRTGSVILSCIIHEHRSMCLLSPSVLNFQLWLYSSSLLGNCAGSPCWEHCLLFTMVLHFVIQETKSSYPTALLKRRGLVNHSSERWATEAVLRHCELQKMCSPNTLHITS